MLPQTITYKMLEYFILLVALLSFSVATSQEIIHLGKHRYEVNDVRYKYHELGSFFQDHEVSYDQFNKALRHHKNAGTWTKVSLSSLGIGVTLFAIYGLNGFELGELKTDIFLTTTLFIFPVTGLAALIRSANCSSMRKRSLQSYNEHHAGVSLEKSQVEVVVGLLSNGRVGLTVNF